MKKRNLNEDFDDSTAISSVVCSKNEAELFYLIRLQFPKVNVEEIKIHSWKQMINNQGEVILVPTWNSKNYFHNSTVTLGFNYNIARLFSQKK